MKYSILKAPKNISFFGIVSFGFWIIFMISFTVSLYKQHTIYFLELSSDSNTSKMLSIDMHYSLDSDKLNISTSPRLRSNIDGNEYIYRFRLPMAKHKVIQFTSPNPLDKKDFKYTRILKPNELLHFQIEPDDMDISIGSKFLLEEENELYKKSNQYKLTLSFPNFLSLPFFDFKQFIFRLFVTIICSAGLLFFAFNFLLKLACKEKDAFKKMVPSFIYLGVFCLILGVKLCIISYAGSIVPIADQWNGEGNNLFIPYLQGDLNYSHLFAPHNEHRLLLNRLSSLIVFELNGRVWDPILSMIFNATFHSFTIIFFIYITTKVFGSQYFISIALAFGLVSLLPTGWDNILWSFQAQFYFYLLTGFVMIYFAFSKTINCRGIVLTIFFSTLCYFSISAGTIVTISVIVVLSIGLIRGPFLKNEFVLLVILISLTLIYWAFTPNVEGHEVAIAKGTKDFINNFLKNMSWPFLSYSWPALIINIPITLLCLNFLIRKKVRDAKLQILVGIFTWLILHSSAIAYLRSFHGSVPSRYTDLSSLIVVINFLSIIILVKSSDLKKYNQFARVFIALWFFLIFIGFSQLLKDSIIKIEERKIYGLEHIENLKNYFSSKDSYIITSKKDFDTSLPFPRPQLLIKWLEDPNVRNLLPIEIYDQGKLGSLNWFKESILYYRFGFILVGIYFVIILPSIIFFKRLAKIHDNEK